MGDLTNSPLHTREEQRKKQEQERQERKAKVLEAHRNLVLTKAQRSCRCLDSDLFPFVDVFITSSSTVKSSAPPETSVPVWSLCSLCAMALKIQSRPKAQN